MMASDRGGITHLIPPILAMAAILILTLEPMRVRLVGDTPSPALLVAPVGLAVLFAFLAFRLNQTTILFSGLTILAGFLLFRLDYRDMGPWLVPVVLPVWLIVIHVMGNGALTGTVGLMRLVVYPAVPVLLMLALRLPVLERALTLPLLAHRSGWNTPLVGLLLIGVFFTLVVSRPWGDGFFSYALIWALVPLYGVLGLSREKAAATIALIMIAAYVILLYSLYRLYWQRVYLDELTGVLNRRAFEERLQQVSRGTSVAMVDVDHFKTFNDTFGHSEGDNVLRYVAQHLSEYCAGMVFRYGGEEFAVVYPRTAMAAAFERLETARVTLEGHTFHIRKPERRGRQQRGSGGELTGVGITMSAGVAFIARGVRPREALECADQALYDAKKTGRNRVVLHRT